MYHYISQTWLDCVTKWVEDFVNSNGKQKEFNPIKLKASHNDNVKQNCKILVVANPNAGNKKGGSVLEQYLKKMIDALNKSMFDSEKKVYSDIVVGNDESVSCKVFTSQYKGHAYEFIKQIARQGELKKFNLIVMVSGDGSIHEVSKGIYECYKNEREELPTPSVDDIPLLCPIPVGSGNALTRSLYHYEKHKIAHKKTKDIFKASLVRLIVAIFQQLGHFSSRHGVGKDTKSVEVDDLRKIQTKAVLKHLDITRTIHNEYGDLVSEKEGFAFFLLNQGFSANVAVHSERMRTLIGAARYPLYILIEVMKLSKLRCKLSYIPHQDGQHQNEDWIYDEPQRDDTHNGAQSQYISIGLCNLPYLIENVKTDHEIRLNDNYYNLQIVRGSMSRMEFNEMVHESRDVQKTSPDYDVYSKLDKMKIEKIKVKAIRLEQDGFYPTILDGEFFGEDGCVLNDKDESVEKNRSDGIQRKVKVTTHARVSTSPQIYFSTNMDVTNL